MVSFSKLNLFLPFSIHIFQSQLIGLSTASRFKPFSVVTRIVIFISQITTYKTKSFSYFYTTAYAPLCLLFSLYSCYAFGSSTLHSNIVSHFLHSNVYFKSHILSFVTVDLKTFKKRCVKGMEKFTYSGTQNGN